LSSSLYYTGQGVLFFSLTTSLKQNQGGEPTDRQQTGIPLNSNPSDMTPKTQNCWFIPPVLSCPSCCDTLIQRNKKSWVSLRLVCVTMGRCTIVGSNPAVAALWDGWGLRDLAWGPPCAAAGGADGISPQSPRVGSGCVGTRHGNLGISLQ